MAESEIHWYRSLFWTRKCSCLSLIMQIVIRKRVFVYFVIRGDAYRYSKWNYRYGNDACLLTSVFLSLFCFVMLHSAGYNFAISIQSSHRKHIFGHLTTICSINWAQQSRYDSFRMVKSIKPRGKLTASWRPVIDHCQFRSKCRATWKTRGLMTECCQSMSRLVVMQQN